MLEKTKAALAQLLDLWSQGSVAITDSGTGEVVKAALAEIESLEKQRAALKVGERVRLASGGPEMTVIVVEKDHVRCAWWAGEAAGTPEIRDRLLPTAALMRVEDEAKREEIKDALEQMLIRVHGVLVSIENAEGRKDVAREVLMAGVAKAKSDLGKVLFK